MVVVGRNASDVPVDSLVSRLGLNGSVRHIPFLDHSVLAPPSRSRSPEALASGCPVVVVDHAALDDASLWERLIRDGLAAAKRLSWDGTARRVMDVLSGVAAG